MSTTTALTPDQVRALPAMLDTRQVFAALNIGPTCGYSLIKTGDFPVSIVPFGRTYRFRKSDVLAFLGLSEAAATEVQSAAAATDDGAPGVQPETPSEQSAPTHASK
ncbi:helix-turn-helix transcriptional regulator [Streptomyces turgidiscabies]|uniref:DNA-binding transcriptional regulator AlpA n=1 Tax=Streptomyces turgidiscabies TaxID=85558 RepID=A0ABU0RP51_9ACTN|nr:helix-turn-helix domain-containing protein [Streptomyces turgidiscabies]MDQ0933769.1 putative DNA-binding transcriptional regulator AlpA [Streptomyces turgidiscabies]